MEREPTLSEPAEPDERLPGSPSAASPRPHYGDYVSATTLEPGSRILVRFKLIGHHNEIDYRLRHWVFERLILWKFKGFFFVAT